MPNLLLASLPVEHGILGNSAPITTLRHRIERVATTTDTVLIIGESGTGKELVAAAIHNQSDRVKGGLVTVNCAAIPENLIESELFGHKKGAYTGAVQDRTGKFMQASRGTLFLDEVGELPMAVQAKLLRALESGEVCQLGSGLTEKSAARVVAATNRPLKEMVEAKTFREDLYYRLNVLEVRTPPLRERRADIPLLVTHYSEKPFTIGALHVMQARNWPGNVRELINTVKRLQFVSDEPMVTIADVTAGVETDEMVLLSAKYAQLLEENAALRDQVVRLKRGTEVACPEPV